MVSDNLLTLSVTILVALFGYLATYTINLRTAQRKDKLERVNQQLREFYGPLFSLIFASDKAFSTFIDKVDVRGKRVEQLTPEELAEWQTWVSQVFMPLNLRMEKIIIENADLMDETQMPDCLPTLCAHVYAYKIILMKWESGDTSDFWPGVRFPGKELLDYVQLAYLRLKAEQAEILGKQI